MAGKIVTFARMPEWVARLPEESRRVFEHCLGRRFPVAGADENGLCILDVSAEVDECTGGYGNDLRLEKEYLESEMD